MREIIFRAIATYGNEFVFGWLIKKRSGVSEYMIQEDGGIGHDVITETIGQYTGLTDKNGKVIYEGDIIHYTQHKGYLLDSFIGEVIWIEDDAAFGYRTHGYDYPFNDADCIQQDILSYMSVIGNIYENKELIKAG